MKSKILIATFVLALFYSCASKPVAAKETIAEPAKKTATIEPTMKAAKPQVAYSKEYGKKAYEQQCANCHKLFAPSDYSKTDWAPILVRMQKKGNIDNAVMASISNYIYTEIKE